MENFEINVNAINQGLGINHEFLVEDVIPELERQAIKIMIDAELVDDMLFNPPGPTDGEPWGLFWVNEAFQQDPDGDHLSPPVRAAVNVLKAASELREALKFGTPSKAAALSMILLSGALAGSQLHSNA